MERGRKSKQLINAKKARKEIKWNIKPAGGTEYKLNTPAMRQKVVRAGQNNSKHIQQMSGRESCK